MARAHGQRHLGAERPPALAYRHHLDPIDAGRRTMIMIFHHCLWLLGRLAVARQPAERPASIEWPPARPAKPSTQISAGRSMLAGQPASLPARRVHSLPAACRPIVQPAEFNRVQVIVAVLCWPPLHFTLFCCLLSLEMPADPAPARGFAAGRRERRASRLGFKYHRAFWCS